MNRIKAALKYTLNKVVPTAAIVAIAWLTLFIITLWIRIAVLTIKFAWTII